MDKDNIKRIQEIGLQVSRKKRRVPVVANMQKEVSRAAEAMPRDELQDEQPEETKHARHGARVTFGVLYWM